MTQTRTIAEWVSSLKWSDLPPAVIRQAKRCLRDFVACAAGGALSEPGRIITEMALNWGGPEQASIVGATRTLAARHAAFANATMANALDYDDTLHGHPGATTFPAAIAAAEKLQASGRDLLLAAVVGYELSVRAMALMEPLIPRYRSMWDLGTLQAYGATAAAARLAGLSPSGVANALGLITGTAPVPLPRKERFPGEGRSMLKSAYGWAADAAIVAVELTEAGFSGPGHALDDNMGFWKVRPALGISSFSDGLGKRWAIEQVEFKPFMACRFIHPVLQGVTELTGGRPVPADAVERVEIRSFSLLADEHHYILRPVSGTDAQFSVPYTVAATLLGGRLTPGSYNQSMLRDPTVLALAERVLVTVDPDFDSAYPQRLGAHVRIVSRGGRTDEITIDHPKGGADKPLSEEELRNKYHSLVDSLLGHEQAERLAAMIDRMDELPDVRSFTRQWSVRESDER